MKNRKGFTDYVVKQLGRLEDNNITPALVKERFESMSDKEVETYVAKLSTGEIYLPFYIANDQDQDIDITKWIDLSSELGADTFVQMVQTDATTGITTTTDIKYWLALWPGRRHLHYLDAKRTLAKDNKTRDTLTGQVTGASKGSSFSKPQLMGLLSRGCTANALEIFKYRGGDIAGGREMNKQLISTGGVSLNSLLQTNTKPTVNKTMGSFLDGMHLKHNLLSG